MTLKKLNDKDYSVPTQLIYGKSYSGEWDYSYHVIPPITASSSFRLGSAARGAEGFEAFAQAPGEGGKIYVYDRMGEPNNDMLQHALAVSEECEGAVTFATGMAAVHAAVCFNLNKGSRIVAHKTLYGCTYSLFTEWLPRFGVEVVFADLRKPETLREVLTPDTRLLYLESPANPTLELLDLEAIANIVAEVNRSRRDDKRMLTVIDNTFATPWCQRPKRFGIDIILHSLTKGIGGFGTEMGGVVITRKEFLEKLVRFRKDFGGILAPKTAWNIMVFGVSTMHLRIPRQQENALKVAQYLEQHPAVGRVSYPGLPSFPQREVAQRMMRDYYGNFAPGIMVYFTLKGDPETSKSRGQMMMDFIAQNAYSVTLAVSLGQLRTLIEHPGSMTHSAYPAEEQLKHGIDPGGIRLAVGTEDPNDIIKDLDKALRAVTA
jgi:cystathionine beta-lyase/cystathionine gamma-synthase